MIPEHPPEGTPVFLSPRVLRDHKLLELVVPMEPRCIDVVRTLDSWLRSQGHPRRLDGQETRVRIFGCVDGLLGREVVEVGKGRGERCDELEGEVEIAYKTQGGSSRINFLPQIVSQEEFALSENSCLRPLPPCPQHDCVERSVCQRAPLH